MTRTAAVGLCEHRRRHRVTGEVRKCSEPAITEVRGGCVHEHMVAGRACGKHLNELLDGRSVCGPCLLSNEGHSCPVTGREARHDHR